MFVNDAVRSITAAKTATPHNVLNVHLITSNIIHNVRAVKFMGNVRDVTQINAYNVNWVIIIRISSVYHANQNGVHSACSATLANVWNVHQTNFN
jgi:hypothetical protein